MKKILFIVTAVLVTSVALHAQKAEVLLSKKAGWHKIGEASVTFKTEKDEFLIMGADRFRAIRIKVTDAPVHIEDMQVHYDGGDKEDISVRSDFKAGGQSRIINLQPHKKGLKTVSFVYHTVPNVSAEKAHLELWGLK